MSITNIICEYDGKWETSEIDICKWSFGLDSQMITITVEELNLNIEDVVCEICNVL